MSEAFQENGLSSTLSEQIKLLEGGKGDWAQIMNILDAFVQTYYEITTQFDSQGRTLLHYAAQRKGHRLAAETVEQILDKIQQLKDPTESEETFKNNFSSFIDALSKQNQTALHFAAQRKNRRLIELLINSGADVALPNSGGDEDAIMLIYKNMPSIIINLFDKNITLEECNGKDDDESVWNIQWNFSPVTGILPKDLKEIKSHHSQTGLLSYVLRTPKHHRSEILLHPLVRLFLFYKHKKFRGLLWASILYHIVWYVLSIAYFLLIIHLTFEAREKAMNMTKPDPFLERERTNLKLSPPKKRDYTDMEFYEDLVYWILFILHASLLIQMVYKEILEFFHNPSKRSYLSDKENIGQWILIVSAFIVHLIALAMDETSEICQNLGVWFSTIGIISASLLLPMQFMTEVVGKYMNMLGTVTTNVLKFLACFSPLLITYSLLFRFLMPEQDEFRFPGMIPKVFVMMAGELEYNDVFHPNNPSTSSVTYPILTKYLFLIFDITVIIVLQNLLVSLAVNDTQELKQNAIENRIIAQLREINLLENFLLSSMTKWFILCVGNYTWIEAKMVPREGMMSITIFGDIDNNCIICENLNNDEEELKEIKGKRYEIILAAIRKKMRVNNQSAI